MSILQQIRCLLQRSYVSFSRQRAQRLALCELMRLGPERLDELGIDAFAVREAFEGSADADGYHRPDQVTNLILAR